MTHWWWVRHAPTHVSTFCGWTDVPADLSDTAQIARVAEYLPPDALVISSDLRRCSATADAIAGARERLPDSARLREMHFGDWEGKSFSEIAESDPALSRAYWETPGDAAPPGGESWNETEARISKFVDEINETYASRHIVAVSHFGAILTQIGRATGKTPHETLGHPIQNLSVTDMRHGSFWQIGEINHVL